MSIAVVDLLQELTDIDTLHESEEGAEVLIDALVSCTSGWGSAGVCKVLAVIPLSPWRQPGGWELCGKAVLPEESPTLAVQLVGYFVLWNCVEGVARGCRGLAFVKYLL